MKEGSIAEIREKIKNLKNSVKKLYDELNFLRELDQVNDNELIYYMNLGKFIETLGHYEKSYLDELFNIFKKYEREIKE